jgi:hypothetical protein
MAPAASLSTDTGIISRKLSVVAQEDRFQYGYWIHPENGYIVTAATWPIEWKEHEKKGFRPLREYGEFSRMIYDVNNRPICDPFAEPYRVLFARGGAKEFPIQQIVEFHWHRRPPYEDVYFPQLDDVAICRNGKYVKGNDQFPVTIYEEECGYCDRVFCALTQAKVTLQRQAHWSVMHPQMAGNDRLADSLTKAQAGQNQQMAGASSQMADAMTMLAQAVSGISDQVKYMAQRQDELEYRLEGQPAKRRGRPPKAEEDSDLPKE